MPLGESAYVPLANLTLTSSATSVTFSSISQAYRDLVVVVTAAKSGGNDAVTMQLNGSSSTIYSGVYMRGNGSSAASSTSGENDRFNFSGGLGFLNTDGYNAVINIIDYSVTDKHKTVLCRADNAGLGTVATTARFQSTTAITSLSIFSSTAMTSGTFALYGIAA